MHLNMGWLGAFNLDVLTQDVRRSYGGIFRADNCRLLCAMEFCPRLVCASARVVTCAERETVTDLALPRARFSRNVE